MKKLIVIFAMLLCFGCKKDCDDGICMPEDKPIALAKQQYRYPSGTIISEQAVILNYKGKEWVYFADPRVRRVLLDEYLPREGLQFQIPHDLSQRDIDIMIEKANSLLGQEMGSRFLGAIAK
jgi:hypothetical protein